MRLLYLLIIAIANVLTAKFSQFVLLDGRLIIPVGSVFVGATFLLRDFVQLRHGRKKTYAVIFIAIIVSAIVSVMLGDTAHIALASAVAFLVSETIDTEIFSRLRRSLSARMMISGIVGGLADSLIFVLIGLSPIGSEVVEWNAIPYAVAGQVVVKVIVQAVAVMCCRASKT
jgi:uncharacterized PurR-regulated membrane protein YhhQ (DUF165 family)